MYRKGNTPEMTIQRTRRAGSMTCSWKWTYTHTRLSRVQATRSKWRVTWHEMRPLTHAHLLYCLRRMEYGTALTAHTGMLTALVLIRGDKKKSSNNKKCRKKKNQKNKNCKKKKVENIPEVPYRLINLLGSRWMDFSDELWAIPASPSSLFSASSIHPFTVTPG